MLLTYREETKQPRRPITGLPAPWVLSSAGKLIRYLHGSYFLPYRNTLSTPDASGVMQQNTIELDAATRQIPDSKLLPHSIYDILTQISMIFNSRFVASSVDRPRQDNCCVRCGHGVRHCFLLFRRRLSFCRRSARLMSVMCTDECSLLASWVDTPLAADWLQVCFGTRPRHVF